MARDHNAAAAPYLARLRDGLKSAPALEREECVREIESHIAEAVASGERLEDVLEKLGPPEKLARAYSLELTLHSRRGNPLLRWAAVLGVVVTASIPSMILVPLLLGLGVGLAGGGATVIGIAANPFAYTPFFDLPEATDRFLGALIGAGLFLSGILCLALLYLYTLLVIRAIRGSLRIGT